MVDRVYSGSTVRGAHFASRPPPPGLAADHTTGKTEPDIFNPQPDTPADQAGTVWEDNAEELNTEAMRSLAQVPISHWYNGQPAVPSAEPYARAQQAMQERMMLDHSDTNYVPDGIRLYNHVSEGQHNEFIIGRNPVARGTTLPTDAQFLANGRNSFDQINQPNEAYGSGGESNVGGYRTGVKTNIWGIYESPLGKFGQDALLHAYTGITPTFPADKVQMNKIAAPYTPNSSGANGYWAPAVPFQVPSMFAVPSETASTDFATGTTDFSDQGEFNTGNERLY